MNIPSIDYRFNDKWLVTSFITPKNPDVENVVAGFGNAEGDEFVEKVASFIRDNFEYPIVNIPLVGDMPSADGQLLRYTQGFMKHGFKCCRYYVWAFPAEVLASKLGYCAETGNLAESLLVDKVDAWATLGDVLDLNDTLLGRHEWVELEHNNQPSILETTIHNEGANNLATQASVYDKESDWAKQGGLYYRPVAWFNNKKFRGDSSIVAMMGLPAKRVLLFGLEETQKIRAKRLYKELQREQKIMENLLKQAWGG